jgi:hypothetical protein
VCTGQQLRVCALRGMGGRRGGCVVGMTASAESHNCSRACRAQLRNE